MTAATSHIERRTTCNDGAHRKPEEIDEAGTSDALTQIVSPLHAQVWLRSDFQNTRTGTRVSRDTDNSGRRHYLKNQEKMCEKIFPRRSRKERNKSKRAENGNTNEITLISANATSWKKNFNEIARLNPDITALQELKVTEAAKPAANRAENRQGDSRTKDSELAQQNEKDSQQKIKHQRSQQRLESTFKLHQEGKNSTNYRGLG